MPTNRVRSRATGDDRHIHVSWEPAQANGSLIAEYVVTVTLTRGGPPVSTGAGLQVGSVAVPFELYSLQNGVTYTITVTARTLAGTEARSDPTPPVTPAGRAPARRGRL